MTLIIDGKRNMAGVYVLDSLSMRRQRHGIRTHQNDAIRFSGGPKSKPNCRSPCTIRHCCHATGDTRKDDWGVATIVGICTVVETVVSK
jgi:hypothetical protein